MLKSGVDRISVSTGDMDQSLSFYRDFVGMTEKAQQEMDPERVQQLWHLPAGTTARAAYLVKDANPTLLQLIEFQPNAGKTIRAGARQWDYGYYDIGFMVNDGEKLYRELTAKDYACVSAPVFVDPDWRPFTFKEFVCYGPDDVMITHIEVDKTHRPPFEGDYGPLMHTCWFVEDMDLAFQFYGDLLGQKVIEDHRMPKGLVDDILTLPSGAELRMGYINEAYSSSGKASRAGVELLETTVKGKLLEAAPPMLGQFSNAFETDDLAGLMETLREAGTRIFSGPVEMEIPLRGAIRSISVVDPCGIMVEFFERRTA